MHQPNIRTQVSPIGGGITNRLFRVVHPAAAATCDAAAAPSAACPAAPPQAVVRLFGDNTELFIDREKELHVMKQLNRAGFGAHVIGTFCNGRVEAWLQARTLDSPDMMRPHLVGMIADHLARFHATEVQLEDTAPQLWPTIRKWCAPLATHVPIFIVELLQQRRAVQDRHGRGAGL